MARQTTQFIIDTEHDYWTHEPSVIQIQFIHTNSVVLLVEIFHLPPHSSVLFWLIRSLLKVVFQPANVLFAWVDLLFELSDFVHSALFSFDAICQMNTIDVQCCFKEWYNQRFPHTCGLGALQDD
ncbi:hypothetical protein, partial [Corallococcus sp. AB038B]|uniref:hypothetical protein n=1 Tax=Corallococcus sp. AB038B TaxID=2316718 RepID=UPI001F4263EF